MVRFIMVALAAALAFAQQRPSAPKPAPPLSEMERAIEEFRIQTRALGIRTDSQARRGTNGGPAPRWHGRVFEYFRNDFLDAVPHEVRQRGGTKSLLRRNQFGFNIAGPVVIPRLYHGGRNTYFSLSYEGVRERISRTYLRTIPTLHERTGDWSQVVDQAGNLLPIYDSNATTVNPRFDGSQPVTLDNLQYPRVPFPGNIIPAARLDPAAVAALRYYPEPNASVGPFFRNNYFINSPETNTANGMIGKLDHTFDERHRVTLELADSNGFLGSARWFPTVANPGPPDREYETQRGSLEHVFTASPQTINTATFGASTDASRNTAEAFPVYLLSPYLSMGRAFPVSHNARNTYAWTNVLSTRRGRHSLRLVGQYAHYQVNTFWPQYPQGSFRFTSGLTSLPGIINTGHALASFLLGLSDYAELSVVPQPSYFRRSSTHFSFRDQYEIRKGLTVAFALSLDRYTPRVEKYDRQSTVDLTAFSPANGRNGALVAAARDGRGRAFQPARARLSPSASLAWNPRGEPKTVVRLGYSRGYSPIPIYTGQFGTQGFNGSPTYISPNVQLAPAVVLSRGLPPTDRPLPDLRPEAADDTVADLIDQSDRQPVYQSASLTLERELPGSVVVSVGAAYSGGRNLLVSGNTVNLNAIHPDALEYRDRLNDETFNRSLRPYPQYRSFDLYSSYPAARYQRDAGFLRVEKRASKGLSFSAYYEFAKQLDDYSGPYGRQDFFNRDNEWSLTAGHEPHRLQFSYIYELPLGASKPFLRVSDWRRHLVDGWSITGVATMQSGNPVYLHPQFNNTGRVLTTLNVNVVPGVDPHLANPGPELWFNPAAFDQPPDFSLGNASRTHPTLRNPGNQNWDLTVNKRVSLAADRTLEVSAAGFNFINHANWTDPDNVIGPASAPNVNAGKIIGSNGGRVIQLGLRFSF